MSDFYKTIYEGGKGEIEEKKSRFIAHIKPVTTIDEATSFIAEIKKEYWDARHNCSAFVLGPNSEITRSSDDGEPSGTAGKPILEVLTGEGLTDVVCVVTRYFGGTLLGTGGLIRAYTQATKEGLANSVIIEKRLGMMLSLGMDYTTEGKMRYFLADNGLAIHEAIYTDVVELLVIVDIGDVDAFTKKATEHVNGRIQIEQFEEVTYANANGKTMIF